MSFNIEVESGSSVRLPTKGKYCDRDIVITATGGTEDLNDVLTEQETLIANLQEILRSKSVSGGSGDNTFNAFIEGTLEEVDCDALTTVRAYFFYSNAGLKRVTLKNATEFEGNNFRYCDALEYLDLPSAIKAGTYFCANSNALVSAVFPKLTTVDNYAFQSAGGVKKLDFHALTATGSNAFRYCSALETLILRKSDGITTCSNSAVLAGSAIASGKGYIYVPSALIDEYKSASNWSKYAEQFRAIEDYPEICGG